MEIMVGMSLTFGFSLEQVVEACLQEMREAEVEVHPAAVFVSGFLRHAAAEGLQVCSQFCRLRWREEHVLQAEEEAARERLAVALVHHAEHFAVDDEARTGAAVAVGGVKDAALALIAVAVGVGTAEREATDMACQLVGVIDILVDDALAEGDTVFYNKRATDELVPRTHGHVAHGHLAIERSVVGEEVGQRCCCGIEVAAPVHVDAAALHDVGLWVLLRHGHQLSNAVGRDGIVAIEIVEPVARGRLSTRVAGSGKTSVLLAVHDAEGDTPRVAIDKLFGHADAVVCAAVINHDALKLPLPSLRCYALQALADVPLHVVGGYDD